MIELTKQIARAPSCRFSSASMRTFIILASTKDHAWASRWRWYPKLSKQGPTRKQKIYACRAANDRLRNGLAGLRFYLHKGDLLSRTWLAAARPSCRRPRRQQYAELLSRLEPALGDCAACDSLGAQYRWPVGSPETPGVHVVRYHKVPVTRTNWNDLHILEIASTVARLLQRAKPGAAHEANYKTLHGWSRRRSCRHDPRARRQDREAPWAQALVQALGRDRRGAAGALRQGEPGMSRQEVLFICQGCGLRVRTYRWINYRTWPPSCDERDLCNACKNRGEIVMGSPGTRKKHTREDLIEANQSTRLMSHDPARLHVTVCRDGLEDALAEAQGSPCCPDMLPSDMIADIASRPSSISRAFTGPISHISSNCCARNSHPSPSPR